MKRFWYDVKELAYYERMHIVKALVVSIFYTVWTPLYHDIYGRTMCHYLGHGKHFVDTGYGGPDSGVDSGHCDRCGWSHHTTLY